MEFQQAKSMEAQQWAPSKEEQCFSTRAGPRARAEGKIYWVLCSLLEMLLTVGVKEVPLSVAGWSCLQHRAACMGGVAEFYNASTDCRPAMPAPAAARSSRLQHLESGTISSCSHPAPAVQLSP